MWYREVVLLASQGLTHREIARRVGYKTPSASAHAVSRAIEMSQIRPGLAHVVAGRIDTMLARLDAVTPLVEDRDGPDRLGYELNVIGDLNQTFGWPDLTLPPDPSALALLIYTSGATGVAKGVTLDHSSIDAMAAVGREAPKLGTADRCLLILRLFDVSGIVARVLTPLLAGANVDIAGRF